MNFPGLAACAHPLGTHGEPSEENAHPHVDRLGMSLSSITESSKTIIPSGSDSKNRGCASLPKPIPKFWPI